PPCGRCAAVVRPGQAVELSGRPNWVLHPQNSLVRVSSWTWTSRPMTVRYGSAMKRLGLAELPFAGELLQCIGGRAGLPTAFRRAVAWPPAHAVQSLFFTLVWS